MFFFFTFETFSGFMFFLLQSVFFCYMFVLVAVEALRLSIFEVVVKLSNVHELTLPSICCFGTCLIIIVFFCGLVSLSDWCYYHFSLLEWLWHCYWQIPQYCFDNIMLYILLEQKDGVMDQDSKGEVKKQLLYWVTQENSIKFLIQSSLPYILSPMVHASYCVPYPK